MDLILPELVGKLKLLSPKLIAILAENFSLIDNQAQFLKATFDIPQIKQLPIDNDCKILIQLDPIHRELERFVLDNRWTVLSYHSSIDEEDICEKIWNDLSLINQRCIIYFNTVSSLELLQSDKSKRIEILKLLDRLKQSRGHFVINLYQGPISNQATQDNNGGSSSSSSFLRSLEYISDAIIRVQSYQEGYFKKISAQQIESKTLIPSKLQCSYYTCKVGKFEMTDMLCFCDRRQVSYTFDPITNTQREDVDFEQDNEDDCAKQVGVKQQRAMEREDRRVGPVDNSKSPIANLPLNEDDYSGDENDILPYTRAQDPEQTRIFYYPDKEDDIDEDDPDNDLGI